MSVNSKINELCAELLKENDESSLSLKQARRIAFEILLHKSYGVELSSENINQEIQYCSFELSLINRKEDAQQIEDYALDVQENPKELLPITSLLLSLRNIYSDHAKQSGENFFKLDLNSLHNINKNAYLPKVLSIQSSSIIPNKKDSSVNFFSNILETYAGTKVTNLMPEILKLKPIRPTFSANTSITSSKNEHKKINTWENIWEEEDEAEKSFSSESKGTLIIHNLLVASRAPKENLQIESIPFEVLLNDLKLLIIGIESESFKRTEDTLIFYATKKLCCGDLTNLSPILESFLETGTCFKRLKTYTSKNPFNQSHIFDGFIFRAFCDRIVIFLNQCRDTIYSQEVETFLELYENTSSIRKIICQISKFLNIHPYWKAPQQITNPTGSDFLKLLYNEYAKTFNKDVKIFYVSLLKACCEVYYLRYQEWFYNGQLDDPHKELFIYYVDHYNPYTKYYFDKAYLIKRQSVPEFLSGCAENVLLCGKYTMLLKSYKPLHPLFMIRKPTLRICLNHEEIKVLRTECDEFILKAKAECGESMSIEEILESRQQFKVEKHKNAELAAVKNMLEWKQQEETRAEIIRKYRERQQEKLQTELQKIEDSKLIKRMEEIEYEKNMLEEMQDIESEELLKESNEITERIKIYKKLNQHLDEASTKQNEIISELNQKLDILNANDKATPELDNTIKDDMNNVIKVSTALSDAQKNKLKIMSHEYNLPMLRESDSKNGNEEITKPLTDAQRNKIKVMGHEFGKIDEATQPIINIQDYDNMTDLQRNRLKVMAHEFGSADDPVPRKKPLPINEMTDLQRNRLKILSHEFGIEKNIDEVPELRKLSLDLLQPEANKQAPESPMSITSDHFSNNESVEKSPEDNCTSNNATVSSNDDDDYEKRDLEMMRAFEDAVEKNRKMFMGINLNDSFEQDTIDNHVASMDNISLAQLLQMSLTLPLNAYMCVLNNETLKMFIQDLDILSHFKSLRNYFLLMNGEFGSCICYDIFSKLEKGVKPSDLLNYQSLHIMLDHALSGSQQYDSNTENLSFIVQNIPEKFELHSPGVLNMLTLSYKLEWPLTLILNPETMEQYRTIFNYLIKLKRINWILEECFQILKESHKLYGPELLKSQQYRNVQQIRHKMTHFIQCLEIYVTRNVLQISWGNFMQDLKSAESILCIYRKHTSYLKRILFLCLLNKKSYEFYKAIEDVFKVILKFHKHLKSKDWIKSSDATYTHAKYEKMFTDAEDFDRLMRYIMYFGNKVVQHGSQKEIYDLLHLIDINGFYSNC